MRKILCLLLTAALLITPYTGLRVYADSTESTETAADASDITVASSKNDSETEPETDTEPAPEPEPEPEPEPLPDIDSLTSSRDFIEILKQREGFEKYPYKDNSQWSIGYGTRVPDGKLAYYQKYGITEEEAEQLMLEMLADFENSVRKMAKKNNLQFTQYQFDALVSFTYNCGDAWTTSTSGNMYRAVTEGWQGSDFLYAICLWSKSAGQFVLINRRLYEANMYINGLYESPYNHETGYFRYIFLEPGAGVTTYTIHGYDIRDPKPIRYEFKSIPKGIDKNGKSFTYEFAGWYTDEAGTRKVEVLDDSLNSGDLLYGLWKDPDGNIVCLPKGEACNLQVTVTKANEYITIRTGPGTQYSKAGKLLKNETVTLTRLFVDGKYTWGQFDRGWIRLDYTNYDEVSEETEVWPKTGVVNANGVNVRSGPGTSNTSQYKLDKGTSVTIYEKAKADNLEWGRLEDGNWICLTYVTFDTTATPEEPEDTPTQPETPPEETPEENPGDEPEESPWPKTGTVKGINVNVRAGPDTDYEMVYKLSTGAKVTIVESVVNGSLTWGRLEDDNWICLKYVSFEEETEPEDPPDEPPTEEPEDPPDDTPEVTSSGDVDGNGTIDKDDAIYLLRHVVYPDKYPLTVSGDADGNGKLDKDDAIYLLYHVVYPDKYPLKFGE